MKEGETRGAEMKAQENMKAKRQAPAKASVSNVNEREEMSKIRRKREEEETVQRRRSEEAQQRKC